MIGRFKTFRNKSITELIGLLIDFIYVVGVQSIRILCRIRRRLHRFLLPVTQPLQRFVLFHLLRPIQHIKQHFQKIFEDFNRKISAYRKLKENGDANAGRAAWAIVEAVLRGFGHGLYWCVNIAAPVAAILVFAVFYQRWTQYTYGLSVQFDGKTLGVVTQEATIREGLSLAQEKLQEYAEAEQREMDYSFDGLTYSLVEMEKESYQLTAQNICTAVVSTVERETTQAAGLYVDGELMGVISSEIDLKFMLQQLLNSHRDPNDPDMTATFMQDVQVVPGEYSKALLESPDEIWALLNSTQEGEQTYAIREGEAPFNIAVRAGISLSQLQALNPNYDIEHGIFHVGDKFVISSEKGFLTVRQVRREVYEKEVMYPVETRRTADLYRGNTRVIQFGQKGVSKFTDLVTYLDGLEVARENINIQAIKEPVTQIVEYGIKERPYSTGTGIRVPAGTYIWPVPSYQFISSNFGYRNGSFHSAVDIAANSGSAILATASGTVTSAGWDSGFGYNINIRHDDGTSSSFYAHCSTLYVSAGQHVSQGQTIAAVGKTGYWATGNHLHFGLYINGVAVNPLNYVTR